MHLFLHIRFIEDKFQFSKPLSIPNVTCFDIDNFSEAAVIDVCNKAIANSEKLMVLFEVKSNIELGGIMRIFNKLAQYQHPLKIVYQGSHPILDKLLKRFESTLDNRKLVIEQKADEFFSD
jgi:hypothetical protein